MLQLAKSENLDSREARAQRADELMSSEIQHTGHFFMRDGRLHCRKSNVTFEVAADREVTIELYWLCRSGPDFLTIDAEVVATADMRALILEAFTTGTGILILDVNGEHQDQVAWAHEADHKIRFGSYEDYLSLQPMHALGRSAAEKRATEAA